MLVETFLPGREFTVGIVGTGDEARVIGSMEIALLPTAEAEVYSYNNKSRWEEFCKYVPRRADDDPEVAEAERVALAAHRASAAATPRALISDPTALAGRISWRSIPWPACIPRIPTCR